MDTEQAKGYLAAMIDGEGHVSSVRDRRGWAKRSVRISNTERDIIDACVEAALALGIEHRVVKQPRPTSTGKAVWTVGFYKGASLAQLAELPIASARKRAALADGIASLRPSRRPPRETLERMYVFEDLSSPEIARLVGVSQRAVLSWLRDEGIPVRTRSEAVALGHRRRAS